MNSITFGIQSIFVQKMKNKKRPH